MLTGRLVTATLILVLAACRHYDTIIKFTDIAKN